MAGRPCRPPIRWRRWRTGCAICWIGSLAADRASRRRATRRTRCRKVKRLAESTIQENETLSREKTESAPDAVLFEHGLEPAIEAGNHRSAKRHDQDIAATAEHRAQQEETERRRLIARGVDMEAGEGGADDHRRDEHHRDADQ